MHIRTYNVWASENGETLEDALQIQALDPCQAAEDWADLAGFDDWDDVAVCVQEVGEVLITRWRVAAEATIIYRAEEIRE